MPGQNNRLYFNPPPDAAARTLRELAGRGVVERPVSGPPVSVPQTGPKYPPFMPQDQLEVDQLLQGTGLDQPRSTKQPIGGATAPPAGDPNYGDPNYGVGQSATKGLSIFGREIGSKSPLGQFAQGADQLVSDAASSPSRFANWLTNDPTEPTQTPYAGNKMGPFAPQGAVAGLNQAGPSASQSPTMNLQMPEDPLKGGSMSIQGGADLRSPGALDNFAALSKQFTPQPKGQSFDPSFEQGFAGLNTGNGMSTEELYKGAYADPVTRAPGSNQWNMEQLGERTGANALAEEKMRQPAEIARINAGGGIRQQEIASQGQRDVASTTAQAARDTSPFGQFLRAGQQLPSNLRGVSRSGFTLGPEQQIPPGALSSLTNAMYAAAQNPTVGMFNKQPSPAAQSLNTAISNIMAFVPNSDQIAGFTDKVINTPDYASKQWNEILQAEGETDLTPEEQLVFRALLQSKRGF